MVAQSRLGGWVSHSNPTRTSMTWSMASCGLTASELEGPVNIGNPEYVSVAELVRVVTEVAGKSINVKYIDGPVGVQSRNFSNQRIDSIGWRARYPLKEAGDCAHISLGTSPIAGPAN